MVQPEHLSLWLVEDLEMDLSCLPNQQVTGHFESVEQRSWVQLKFLLWEHPRQVRIPERKVVRNSNWLLPR